MKIRLLAIIAFSALMGAGPLWAAEFVSVAAEKANVRAAPGLDAEVLWSPWRSTPFEVLERRGEWVHVSDFEGDTGWMHTSVLSEAPGAIVTAKTANLRRGPGMDYEIVFTLMREYPLLVSGHSGNWVKVVDRDEAGVEGWVYYSLLWGNIREGY